jgi:hypothetical protein
MKYGILYFSDSIVQCPASGGLWRDDGEMWMLDECTECQCHSGLTRCNKVQCDIIESCGWISIPVGECCHQCMGKSLHLSGLKTCKKIKTDIRASNYQKLPACVKLCQVGMCITWK